MRLRQRRDFLKAQKGRRANSGLFSVQAIANDIGEPRIGFTVSKKVDTRSVKRNRIRRRLKEAARMEAEAFQTLGCDGAAADIVIVARPDALTADFGRLRSEIRRTAAKVLGPVGSGEPTGKATTARSGRSD